MDLNSYEGLQSFLVRKLRPEIKETLLGMGTRVVMIKMAMIITMMKTMIIS